MANHQPPQLVCSFCERKAQEVKKIIVGKNAYICNICVDNCAQTIGIHQDGNKQNKHSLDLTNIPIPANIKTHLDKFVIGQNHAKITLSVSVYNHYKRLKSHNKSKIEIDKSNILFLGPTGTGKTLMARSIAKILKVPFCIVDATTLTEAGYVGEDVDNIIVRLLQAADYKVPNAEQGIIYIDEFDKISRTTGANPSITRDVSGEGVQQALLKILEGTICSVPPQGGRKHPEQPLTKVNTQNILFICGGAFDGLEKIIEKRQQKHAMGFTKNTSNPISNKKSDSKTNNDTLAEVQPKDLIKFGIIPELVGRVPVITHLNSLDKTALLQILTQPKNALIKQYQSLFEIDGVSLEFQPKALEEIVNIAMDSNTGARGLRGILEKILIPIMYKLPSQKKSNCLITSKVVTENATPTYS